VHGFYPNAFKTSDDESKNKWDKRKNTALPHIMPEFDRLYLDMNGIIHCASHNNSEEELEKEKDVLADNANNYDKISSNEEGHRPAEPSTGITEEQIFQNVCYYLDRVVTDIVQPKQLVYLAIDGVAPRAKMNQQRSRRYRSGSEKEIEMHLITLQRAQEKSENTYYGDDDDDERISREYLIEADGGAFGGSRGHRFTGTITAGSAADSNVSSPVTTSAAADQNQHGFHSNCITPGTPFLYKCSQHILTFVRQKLDTDPKWQNLTIIFSGHDVPGEGEHKIMEFIRHEKNKPGYDPNTRHCLFGQDGDLIMLALATHEPHFCLLREEVVFDIGRKKAIQSLAKLENQRELNDVKDVETLDTTSDQPPLSAAIQSYIHNSNFELLHLSVLRDYLALEFETSEFYPSSRYQLEQTIDDFVFLTFLVGNDFLPHMPALDIGEEAFDLIFYAYKKNRGKWLSDGRYRRTLAAEDEPKTNTINHPYLTDAGRITSGSRLSEFLADVGRYEDPFFDNKKFSMTEDNERMRKADKKAGRESLIPSDEILEQVEQAGRKRYRDMLIQMSLIEDEYAAETMKVPEEDSFRPVTSSRDMPEVRFDSVVDEKDDALVSKFGGLLRGSLSPEGGGVAKMTSAIIDDSSLVDLKGRYYYDKFGFTPFDSEKHLSLRRAYLEGLVWTLEYYYRGCPSWGKFQY
jgi:5'-3' exonuclease